MKESAFSLFVSPLFVGEGNLVETEPWAGSAGIGRSRKAIRLLVPRAGVHERRQEWQWNEIDVLAVRERHESS